MATKVGLAKIWMTPLDWPTPKTPHRCKILGSILNASWVIAIFVWKFPHFRYHGNRGSSDKNLNYTVKSAVPENPIWRKNLSDISYTSWVIADFLMKFADFCYHGNKGWSSENLNDSIGLADPENPTQVQNSGIYLKCELSYSDFCVEISTFSLPWQQGLVWQKYNLHS